MTTTQGLSGIARCKVAVVFGTRPEAIKMAPVVERLREASFQPLVVATGQHRELLEQVLRVFNIAPDYHLNVMTDGQTLDALSGRLLVALGEVYRNERPDVVMVQGDTTTTMTAALCAYYHKIPVAYVEAGLRSGDKLNPFPEEVNRRIVSCLADLNFAPTKEAQENLIAEGCARDAIFVTGNTVIDALQAVLERPYELELPGLAGTKEEPKLLVVTAHRRESWGDPLNDICRGVQAIVQAFPDIHVVFSVHPNPVVMTMVRKLLRNVPRITLTPPLDYLPFVHLLAKSYLVLTDSGGIQEEAPHLGKPVLVLRSVTERNEGVLSGQAEVIGTSPEAMMQAVGRLLADSDAYRMMAGKANLYGDGKAAVRIVHEIERWALQRRKLPLDGSKSDTSPSADMGENVLSVV